MYTIIILIITMIMFMVLSVYGQANARVHPVHPARWLTTVKPSQTIWAVSQPEQNIMHKIHRLSVKSQKVTVVQYYITLQQ